MRNIKVVIAMIAACLAAAFAVAGVTGSALAGAAITAVTQVSNHPDTTSVSGPACKMSLNGPQWAVDTYKATFTATKNSSANSWHVVVTDEGSFQGFADPATCAAMLSFGDFDGKYSFTVTSNGTPSQANLQSSYSSSSDSTSLMVKDFFADANATVTAGDYIFSYQGGNYVQDSNGSYGDVSPAPAPVLSLAYCGSHVWKVTQNKSLVATKFRYFSKVGTSTLLDGAATVASASSVKVSERPRATGSLIVRYPSAGHMVTVAGSRTLVVC